MKKVQINKNILVALIAVIAAFVLIGFIPLLISAMNAIMDGRVFEGLSYGVGGVGLIAIGMLVIQAPMIWHDEATEVVLPTTELETNEFWIRARAKWMTLPLLWKVVSTVLLLLTNVFLFMETVAITTSIITKDISSLLVYILQSHYLIIGMIGVMYFALVAWQTSENEA